VSRIGNKLELDREINTEREREREREIGVGGEGGIGTPNQE